MGGLLAYRVENYKNTAEREQFRLLCEQLAVHYKESEELCVFAGNYNIGCELDALLIKNDAIITIEFKNYGGHIVANENGNWTSDGKVIKGGARATVLQQARTNHSIVKKELRCLGIESTQIKDIPTLVVFHQPIELENKLSGTTKSWLHITDDEHFLNKIDDITCPKTDLSREEIIKLVELLNLSPYLLNEFSSAGYDELESQPIKVEPSEDANGEKEEKVVEEKTEKLPILDDSSSQSVDIDVVVAKGSNSNKEKDELKAFISTVLKTQLKDTFVIEVIDWNDKRYDNIFPKRDFSQKYIVKVESENISSKAAKIGKFIGKEIVSLTHSCIFWEDGGELPQKSSRRQIEPSPIGEVSPTCNAMENLRFRKSKTILPHWLDRKIFEDLKATYAPEHERYQYNLDLNSDELKVYLGTYFPRSYAEMFCIVDNLLQNDKYKEVLNENEEIKILDCGCGTGGEIIGLITAFGKHLSQWNLNITAIDGNKEALRILQNVVCEFPTNSAQHINITPICRTIKNSGDLSIHNSNAHSYQFILCDKMVCELISKGILKSDAYMVLAKFLAPHIAENGLLIILDVTTKDCHTGCFYPQLMNKGLNEFVERSKTIGTLLPLACAFNDQCKDLCFMQQSFYVSHSRKSEDESRVCYRVLCKNSLKKKVIGCVPISEYKHLIRPVRYTQNDEYAICRQSVGGKTIIDTFNIKI